MKPQYIGIQVGTATVSEQKPLTKELSHEVAAWSTTVQSIPGTYPICIGWEHYSYGTELSLYVTVDGVVTKNFTPSLFGGVRIGDRDGSEEVGRPHGFSQVFNFLDLLRKHEQKTYDGNMSVQFTDSPELRAAILLAVEQAEAKNVFQAKCVDEAIKENRWGMVAHYAKAIEWRRERLEFSTKVRALFAD